MTILAFVYVPLNLATSIFGMNLQQLNQNGQHIWVFVITTIALLILTCFIWISTVQYLEYMNWRRDIKAYRSELLRKWQERGSQGYSFFIRVALLIDLLRVGCGRWVWTTNAWILILTDDDSRISRIFKSKGHPLRNTDYGDLTANDIATAFNQMTICDYVCTYLKDDNTLSWRFDADRYQKLLFDSEPISNEAKSDTC